MPDAHLICPGYLLMEEGKVLQTQIVTRIQTESDLAHIVGRLHKGAYSRLSVDSITSRIRLCIELYAISPCPLSIFCLFAFSRNKDTRANAFLLKAPDDVCQL